jgi:hypothetical protein
VKILALAGDGVLYACSFLFFFPSMCESYSMLYYHRRRYHHRDCLCVVLVLLILRQHWRRAVSFVFAAIVDIQGHRLLVVLSRSKLRETLFGAPARRILLLSALLSVAIERRQCLRHLSQISHQDSPYSLTLVLRARAKQGEHSGNSGVAGYQNVDFLFFSFSF